MDELVSNCCDDISEFLFCVFSGGVKVLLNPWKPLIDSSKLFLESLTAAFIGLGEPFKIFVEFSTRYQFID